MKYDGFQENQKLFIFGIICLVLSISLLFFSIYILPFLIWDINYGVPSFLTVFIVNMHDDYGYSNPGAKFLLELLFLIPGLIAGLISYFISHYIDQQNSEIYPDILEAEEGLGGEEGEERIPRKEVIKREIKESANFGLKLLALMIVAVIAVLILQALL